MTDAVTLVPGDPATTSTDAPVSPAPVANAQPEAPVADTAWLSALDEETRKAVEAHGIKTPADAVAQFRAQRAEYSKLKNDALVAPKDDAPKEDWDKFYSRLGRPEKADGYQLKLPEGLPKELPYDEGFANEFKGWAHASGLNPAQAQSLHDGYVAFAAKQVQAQAAHYDQLADASSKDLEKAWGAPDSPDFQRNLGVVQRVIASKGDELKAALSSGPIMDAQGRVSNSAIVRLIAELAADKFTNDTVISGSPAPSKAKDLAAIMFPNM